MNLTLEELFNGITLCDQSNETILLFALAREHDINSLFNPDYFPLDMLKVLIHQAYKHKRDEVISLITIMEISENDLPFDLLSLVLKNI